MTTPRPARGPIRATICGALLAALVFPGTSRADSRWLLSAEAPAAVPITSPQRGLFGIGGMPSLAGFYAVTARLLVGVRARGGALSDGGQPARVELADPGTAGLGSASVALRMRPLTDDPGRSDGPWVELTAGGAVTGADVQPIAEMGIGWGVRVGPVTVGPSLRYLHVRGADSMISTTGAGVALLGVELSVTPGRREPLARPARPRFTLPADSDRDGVLDPDDECPGQAEDRDGYRDGDGCTDADNDLDRIADIDDACPDEPEDRDGVSDADGCPEHDPTRDDAANGRRVLDQRVLFDTDRARVQRKQRRMLRAVVEVARRHPEWVKVIVEGHADDRGTSGYNLELSQLRAQRVVDALIALGMPAHMLEAIGRGDANPRVTGTSRKSRQANRRVELIVITAPAPVRESDTDDTGELRPPLADETVEEAP